MRGLYYGPFYVGMILTPNAPILYLDIDVDYSESFLYNEWNVSRVGARTGGQIQTASDSTSIAFGIAALITVTLRLMVQWTIVGGPREYEPSGGTDAERGWAWDLERYGVQSTVRVELARTAAVVLAAGGPIANEAERAVQTRGQSAVELWLDEETLPERIVIHTEGVTHPSE